MTSLAEYIEIIRVIAPSLVTALALGMAASVVGVFVLLRREAMVALAMPHVVAVGAAMGLLMGWPTLPPALVAVAAGVVLLVWSRGRGTYHWLLPSLYVAGLSLSFLIIAGSGAHVAELQALFTGVDVAVSVADAAVAVPVLLVAGVVCAMLWRRWLLLAQSPATAEVAGLRPGRWEVLFLGLLATVLLVGTSGLGALMVLAMLFLPAAAVLPLARRVPIALVMSAALSALLLVAGLVLSVEWNLPLSQSVGGVGFVTLLVFHLLARHVH